MDTVKQKPKETDITGILVLVLVVLTGLLIVRVSNVFTSKTTSTTTQAARDKHATCYQSRPFSYDSYLPDRRNPIDASNFDYCPGTFNKCAAGYVRDLTASKWGKNGLHADKCVNNCCRSLSEVQKLGTSMCQKTLNDVSAVCASSQYACPSGLIATTTKCGYISASNLVNGTCCAASLTPMPTPTPQPITFDHTNCGPMHLNCLALFGDGNQDFNSLGDGIGNQDGRHNFDSAGRRMKGVCTIPDQFSNEPNKEQFAQCAIRLADETQQLTSCEKGVYAFAPSLGNNYCYVSLPGATSDTIGKDFKICLVKAESLWGNTTCKQVAQQ